MHIPPITHSYLKDQIGPVLSDSVALAQKVEGLVQRLMTEMTTEQLNQIQYTATCELTNNLSPGSFLINKSIIEMIIAVKKVQSDIVNLQQAQGCIDVGQYEQAHKLLGQITNAEHFKTQIEQLRSGMPKRDSGEEKPLTYEEIKKGLWDIPMDDVQTFQAELIRLFQPFSTRMCEGLSVEELAQIQRDAAKDQESAELDSKTDILASCIREAVGDIKDQRPDLIKIQQANKLIEEKKFSDALHLLNTIAHPGVKQQAEPLVNMVALMAPHESDESDEEEIVEKVPEEPARRATAQIGENLIVDGNRTWRQTVPAARLNSLPSDSQMRSAAQGLHGIARAVDGELTITGYEGKSTESLKQKYAFAQKELEQERINYDAAVASGSVDHMTSALKQKQHVMQKVGILHNMLVERGVLKDRPADTGLLNETLLRGAEELLSTVQDAMDIPPEQRTNLRETVQKEMRTINPKRKEDPKKGTCTVS